VVKGNRGRNGNMGRENVIIKHPCKTNTRSITVKDKEFKKKSSEKRQMEVAREKALELMVLIDNLSKLKAADCIEGIKNQAKVDIGTTFTVYIDYGDDHDIKSFTLYLQEKEGKLAKSLDEGLSHKSPFGKAVMGKGVGDNFHYRLNVNDEVIEVRGKILDISDKKYIVDKTKIIEIIKKEKV
jgi:transcription elongation GreA/GreB family factor